MTSSPGLITLTSDFGWRDPYAAAVKGVIYRINPRLRVIDLTHDIPPQDVFEGSLFLASAMPFFPEGTVHIAVVDPGVGTDRHPIALWAGGQILVCPDNGLPTFFLQNHRLQEARIIDNREFMLPDISPTFHGRDLFAPAAAYLASGTEPHELGEELDTVLTIEIPRPNREDDLRIRGEIIHVDRFGNLVTNIHESMLGNVEPHIVRVGRHRMRGLHRTYAEVNPGMPVVLVGSTGHIEIAVNGGNAHAALRLGPGDAVTVVFSA